MFLDNSAKIIQQNTLYYNIINIKLAFVDSCLVVHIINNLLYYITYVTIYNSFLVQ